MYKAYVTHGTRHLVSEQRSPTALTGNQVRLKVRAVGICGSDHHIYLGQHPYAQYPIIQGHEFVGTVQEYGPQCKRTLPLHTQVVVEPLISCGTCHACTLGRYNCCEHLQIIGVHLPGAFQEQVVVPETALHPVNGVPAEIAVFAEPLSIALQAVRRGKVGANDTVLILGAGAIGLASVLACKHKGAKVAIVDLLESRLEKARHMGADLALNSSKAAKDIIRQWSGGGVTVVIDAVAAEPAIRLGMELLHAAGRFVLVGMSGQTLPIPIGTLIAKEVDIIGSRNSAQIFPEAVTLMQEHAKKIAELVFTSAGLDSLPSMMDYSIDHPDQIEKVVITL